MFAKIVEKANGEIKAVVRQDMPEGATLFAEVKPAQLKALKAAFTRAAKADGKYEYLHRNLKNGNVHFTSKNEHFESFAKALGADVKPAPAPKAQPKAKAASKPASTRKGRGKAPSKPVTVKKAQPTKAKARNTRKPRETRPQAQIVLADLSQEQKFQLFSEMFDRHIKA